MWDAQAPPHKKEEMVGKRVEVVGTLEEVKGQRTITVKAFKEIKQRLFDRVMLQKKGGGFAFPPFYCAGIIVNIYVAKLRKKK